MGIGVSRLRAVGKKIIFWLKLWYKTLGISKKSVLLKIKGGSL